MPWVRLDLRKVPRGQDGRLRLWLVVFSCFLLPSFCSAQIPEAAICSHKMEKRHFQQSVRVPADPLHEQDPTAKPHTARACGGDRHPRGPTWITGSGEGARPEEDPRAGAQGRLALLWHVS